MNQKWCRGCTHLDYNEMSDEMYCKLKEYELIRLRWHKHRPDWCPLVKGAGQKGEPMRNVKPCPFCGRTPRVEDCGDHRWFIRCACGIAQDKLYAQKCDAVKAWNRRKGERIDE